MRCPGSLPTRSFLRHGAAALGLALGAASLWAAGTISPENTPDPLVPGFQFPEGAATLSGWITDMIRGEPLPAAVSAAERLHAHGWGLWTALTLETGQVYEGQRLRVFETWLTPEDLTTASGLRSVADANEIPRRRAPLRSFAQLNAAGAGSFSAEAVTPRVVGFVKFDPVAADHILRQDLLSRATLDTLLRRGAPQIPAFPAAALVVKPVFQVIKRSDLIGGRYSALQVWPGPPETPRALPPAQWPDVVWLDLLDGGSGGGAVDSLGATDGSTRTDETTYPVSRLIHYRLSAADAAVLDSDKPGTGAQPGDLAVLVAMHVTTREIARWTWQTFWWTPEPETPLAPSSSAIASLRPQQLRGAARNYAMALAYTMQVPDQPQVRGNNSGAAVYAYNPWIEARFAPADLPDSIPGLDPLGRPAANNHGVQSNCLSCHAQANYNPDHLDTAPRFTGARYVDLADPKFNGTLQVDFLWTIARHAR